MTSLWDRASGQRSITTLEDYASALSDSMFSYGGNRYPLTNGYGPNRYDMTYGSGTTVEGVGPQLTAMARAGYQSSGPIFACILIRMAVFSSVRFLFQKMNEGRPSKLYGDARINPLDEPWVGGTTQDMLARMEVDVSLVGNSYWVRVEDELVRLDPTGVDLLLAPRVVDNAQLGFKRVAYLYHEGGANSGADPVMFDPSEIVHYAPLPDPLATYMGQSWMTPIVREVQDDRLMSQHKRKFYEQGAPQPLTAKILTPSGWSTMGDMKVGSRVIGSDGQPHEVTAIYPQGDQAVYRVGFTRGESVECTADHLWTVSSHYDRKLGRTRTMTTRQIVEKGIYYKSGPAKWSVQLVDPIEYEPDGDLPVDPYLLGTLLGDCSFRSGNITLASHIEDADEQEAMLRSTISSSVPISRRDRGMFSEFYVGRGELHDKIRELGLFDKLGYEKSIPIAYLHAPIKDRVAVLQGLIDTDGAIEPTSIRFSNTSEQLCTDLVHLVNGLGGIATMTQVREGCGNHRPQWRVTASRLPGWITPVRLHRKVAAYQPPSENRRAGRMIRSIEFVRRDQVQCIAVDSVDHLYVTDNYVLTHNTPNMIIRYPAELPGTEFEKFAEMARKKMDNGARDAYKTLFLGGGVDATIVGRDFRQIDFKQVQGAGETRIAAAAGVPPVIAGFSEGLQAATYSNYAQARRRFADGTIHPLWQNIAGSLARIVSVPDGSRLWYDCRDVPFLREDSKDQALIQSEQATVMLKLINSGFKPDKVRDAVVSNDWDVLEHTGFVSVQLLPPGTFAQPISNVSGEPTNNPPVAPAAPAAKAAPAKPAEPAKKAPAPSGGGKNG